MLKTLGKRIREFKIYTILTPILMVGEVFMEVMIPTLMALIIDNGVQNGDMGYIWRMSIYLLGAAMLSLTFGVLSALSAAKASTGFAKNVRQDLFYKIQSFSFKNVDSFSTSSLITRMTTDVQNVQQAFQMMIRITVRAPIMFIFALIMVARNGGSLVLVFVCAIPVIAILIGFIIKTVYPRFERAFKNYDVMNRVVQENVTNIRTVKAFVREDEENEKFSDVSGKIKDDFISAQKIIQLSSPIMMFASYACILVLAYTGARLINAGTMGTGQLMSIFTYTMQILSSLMMIAMIVVMFAISKASAVRIVEVLNTETTMDINENGLASVSNGSVSFKNVNFSYTDNMDVLCLKDIDLDIKAGETVGILGGTGSGKSSLISLIARLYDTTQGSVSVGGVDVKKYSLKALRNSVAVVLQKNQLFSGTIRSNMLWGNENASDDEIKRALDISHANFVFDKDAGLDSVVEQGGTNFSGGQKQRLCIARALLKNPKVLIFDDSTSAVDTATDASIREELKNSVSGMTKIIIAQRVNSVMDADKIVILKNGRIQQVGTHEDLLATNKIYQELYAAQTHNNEEVVNA